MKKNLIITGINGQDGKILTKFLHEDKKYNLIGFSKRKIFTKKASKIKIFNFLNNKKKLLNLFRKVKPDLVIHLASNNPAFGENSKKLYYNENIITTKNLFQTVFSKNPKAKFIFCSSSQIFKKKNGRVKEKNALISTSDYTHFRIESDKYMLNYKRKNKIKYTNAILFNHDSKFRNNKFIFPRIIKAIIKKDVIFLNKVIQKNIYADFSHAEDIVIGLIKLIESKKNPDKVIFSSGKLTSVNLIIKEVIKKNNLRLNLNFKKIKLRKRAVYGDNNFAKSLLKWFPKKNIFDAVNELYDYYVLKHTNLK